MDSPMWQASDSPEETFSDAEGGNEEGEWPVEIIGEEIVNGEPKYEARWPTWRRTDGTNVTWNNDLLTTEAIRPWKSYQRRKRQEAALQSLDIKVWATYDIHNGSTILRAQAFKEKLEEKRKRRSARHGLEQRMATLLAEKKRSRESTSPSISTTDRQSRRNASTLSGSVGANSARSIARTPNNAAANTSRNATNTARTLNNNAVANGSGAAISTQRSSGVTIAGASSTGTSSNKRRILIDKWNRSTKRWMAAPVNIVNDVDDEEFPPLADNFKYLESRYFYDEGLEPPTDKGYFMTCDCTSCKSPENCACQGLSELFDDEGQKVFAYTPNGLFAFNTPPGTDVIECNRYCACNDRCPNRVAQRPRDVPIEIFKTPDRGWGVRSPKRVRRGKVLGIYTGLLIERSKAERLPDRKKGFCFDLDGQEDPEDENERSKDGLYTVDGRRHGNWSRFLNHSCSPNVQVYQVIYDTIPGANIPYIAFVALRDIPAREEFTVDYDPAAARRFKKGKGRLRKSIPLGALPCLCGSAECRGWLRV